MSNVFVLILSACLIPAGFGSYHFYQVTINNGQHIVSKVRTNNPVKYFRTVDDSRVAAKALYRKSYDETGWDIFQVSTNEAFSDEEQAYAAGLLEGSVTHDSIYNHWYNMLSDFCEGRKELCRQMIDFVSTNLQWVYKNVEKYGDTSDYWHQIKIYYKQIEGVSDGYKTANKDEKKELPPWGVLMMNNPDLNDIMEAIKANITGYTQVDLLETPTARGTLPCSALIKVLPNGSEIFTGQVTWSEYASMLRIQKKYDFAFHTVEGPKKEIIAGRSMTFSSYPGVTTSGDDFYVISSGLVTMETTIGNSNTSLWRNVRPDGQVSEGARSMVANRLSRDGKSWAKVFSAYNSGTYNNQWMVLDYKKFKTGTTPKNLPDGLLWVSEQIPGLIRSEDVTSVLRKQGYWPSYNVAYFKDVFNISGNQEFVNKFGDWFTYEKNPRALIFQRDQGQVKDLSSMLELMRYNDFKNDPLSRCNCTPPYSAENAISARCDLNPSNGSYPFPALGHRSHGATDAKITSKELLLNGLQFLAVSGPPYNESRGVSPFQWSLTDFNTTRHEGHPDIWKFEPIIHKWR